MNNTGRLDVSQILIWYNISMNANCTARQISATYFFKLPGPSKFHFLMLIKVSTHYSWERKLSNKNIGTSGSGCKPCRKPTRKTKIAVDQWLKPLRSAPCVSGCGTWLVKFLPGPMKSLTENHLKFMKWNEKKERGQKTKSQGKLKFLSSSNINPESPCESSTWI